MSTRLIKNMAGRMVPEYMNGELQVPYMGVGKYKPAGRKYGPSIPVNHDFPHDGNKCVDSLRTALIKAGLRDGMTISTHHHFRNGDFLANAVFDVAHEMGVKDLRWFPSASFACHEHLIKYLEDGTIQR
ncbi:MAG: citrate lyase subunit alpha, partial [Bacteroidales bacterium]|nr:citrate lyase subunit alpha [Bacteroidales bacterium]